MSEIGKTAPDGTAEFRDDGSKVATEISPVGETETEATRREQSQLPGGGESPDYKEAERKTGIAAPSTRSGA